MPVRRCMGGESRWDAAGRMVASARDEMPQLHRGMDSDVFVVMPNHIHGIIVITDAPGRGRPPRLPSG